MPSRITYLVPGFHSDVVWLEDQRDYAVSLMGDMEQNLMICRADPSYGVFLHELTYVKPYLDIHPEERDDVRRWIREGRVGTGGSHSQPTEAVVSGEGLVRNILYGRLYHEGQLGDRPRIYMPWDVFGHATQLAQILRKSRFDGCIWSKDIRGALAVFRHLAPDGSSLVFKRMGYGFPGWTEEDTLRAVERCYEEMASLGFTADCRLDATDFKPPSSWFAGRCGELRARQGHAVVVSGKGHERWLDHILADEQEGRARVPITARDYEWHHQGTGLSRVEFKIANRLAENLLITAEKLATFAWLLGAEYPDRAIDKAWRQLLFNQHHDGITGPCCDRSYLDLMLGFREALDLAHDCATRSAAALASAVDTSPSTTGARPVVVFNPLNWSRTEPVRASVRFSRPAQGLQVSGPEGPVPAQILSSETTGGKLKSAEVLFLASAVPGIGYSTYEVTPARTMPDGERVIPGTTIRNEFLRVTADPSNGCLVSIFDRQASREVLDTSRGLGNELIALAEKPDRGEPAWECHTTGPRWSARDYNAKVTAYAGPVRQRLVIRGEMKGCAREQIVTLYEGVARIDFETRLIAYKGEHELFVVAFPVAVKGAEPVFEERFGAITKRKSRGKLDFRFHQWRNYSDCGARRCAQWIDLSGAARIHFDDGRSVTLGMTNIVTSHAPASVAAAERLQLALVRQGVPVTPSYDDCDWERRRSLPTEDTIMPRPDSFNEDLNLGTSFRIAVGLAGDNTYVAHCLGQLDPTDRRSVLGLVEAEGAVPLFLFDHDMPSDWPPLPVLLILARDEEGLGGLVDWVADDLSDSILDLPAESCLVPGELGTDHYGVGLLNTGNVLASVERDDTLVLFLMHTAAWGGTPWGKDRLDWFLVPEHKTHTFHYSLVPHAGDWREGEVVRTGYELNNPLIPVAAKPSKGSLPPAGHLLEVGGRVVVTAVKPKGNPTAELSGRKLDRGDGIVVRVYEPEGRDTSASIRPVLAVESAVGANLLEEPARKKLRQDFGYVRLAVSGFGIETALLKVAAPEPGPLTGTTLGRERELAPVVHFRHWDHNAGAEPLGYSPVAVSLRGTIKEGIHIRQGGVTINTVEVFMSNNLVDTVVEGEVELIARDGWHTVPARVPYRLEPLSHISAPVLLCFDAGRRDRDERVGLLKARIEHEGTVYQDVMEVGRPLDIDWHIRRGRGGARVELRNPTPDTIEGQVYLVTPLEMFGECAGPYALGEAGPRETFFSLAPGEETVVDLALREDVPGVLRHGWAVVKVTYNGRVFYRPV